MTQFWDWKPEPPRYAGICASLIASKKLTAREVEFLDQIAGHRRLSPKQARWLGVLTRKVGDTRPRSRLRDDLDDELLF
jgi:hypothetical protein